MELHELARRDCCLPGIDVMPAPAMIPRIETVNCSGPETEVNVGPARMEFLARSIIALTIGIVFLIAMLFALAADVLSGSGRSRRQTATRSRRNRAVVAWS
jgi:hypothetical protein